jgi:IS4 transposase
MDTKYYNHTLLDLYSDYLLSSFGRTTATGLSELLDGEVSHDQVSRFLRTDTLTSADLWRLVKPLVRQVECEEAILIIDDSLIAKPYTDESELICWHWDHTQAASVKGINLLTALYHSPLGPGISVPVAFELVTKPDLFTDPKTGQQKRRSVQTKNDLYRKMLQTCVANQIPFRYVVNDVWYSAAENMRFIKETLGRDFVMPLKSNRKVALSETDKRAGSYRSVSSLDLPATLRVDHRCCVSPTVSVWLEGVPFALQLSRQVFTNEDGSQGVVYLVTSDTALSAEQMMAIYQRRWKVEEYHKSLKSNASLEQSPTRTVRTQTNHIFASLYAYVKLEKMRLNTKLNHFAMKAKLYIAATKTALDQLRSLQANCSTA